MRHMCVPMLRCALTLALLCAPRWVAAQSEPVPLTRLHQLPTTDLLRPGTLAGEWGETTTFGGQIAEGGGGSGNQTYQAWAEAGLHRRVMLFAFFDGNDDPTYGLIAGRRWAKEFTTIGGGVRVLLGEAGPARFAVEGALATFGLRSEDGLFTTDTSYPREYFTVGTLSAIASADFAAGWRATFAPTVTSLPSERDGVPFFGWTVLLGAGVDGYVNDRVRLFASSDVPLAPGYNSITTDFEFVRTALWSAGGVYEASPRVQLIAFLTNQSGAGPATRHLPLLGEIPVQYGARMRFSPMASERASSAGSEPRVARSQRRASGPAAFGGLGVPQAEALGWFSVDATLSLDHDRSRSALVRLGLSDELDFEMGVVRTPGLGALATLGINLDEGTHYRVGTKLTLLSEAWGSPATVAVRFSGGQDFVSQKGYLMAEAIVRRRLREWVEVTLAPAFVRSSGDTPVALGLSGVFGRDGGVQVILEPTLLLTGQSSLWTAGVRLPAVGPVRPHFFATTARSNVDIGRLLGDPGDVRLGAMARVRLW